MLSLRVSVLAQNDLKNIARYTFAQWGLQQRNEYLSRLNDRFEKLLITPKIGIACDDIRAGYRKLREGEHIIFYQVNDNTLDVVRILHKSMDVVNKDFLRSV